MNKQDASDCVPPGVLLWNLQGSTRAVQEQRLVDEQLERVAPCGVSALATQRRHIY